MMQCNMRFLAAAALATSMGCAGSSNRACVSGADCATGACSASGECVAAPAPEAGTTDASSDATDSSFPLGSDGSDSADPDGGQTVTLEDGAVVGCIPNGDGTITQDEIPMQAGLHATYLDAQNATWDTTGTGGDGGTRAWDLTVSLSGDQPVIFTTQTPTGTWWTSAYAGATYASLLSATATLLGVFKASDNALLLLGVVSPTNTTETELTYATPIVTLQFPLSVGTTWSTTTNVTGLAEGITTGLGYTEAYTNTADEWGTMKTPYGTFQVLRVGTVLTRTVGIEVTTIRSYAWIAECVGPVASATSQNNETSTEFTSEAELRRLTP